MSSGLFFRFFLLRAITGGVAAIAAFFMAAAARGLLRFKLCAALRAEYAVLRIGCAAAFADFFIGHFGHDVLDFGNPQSAVVDLRGDDVDFLIVAAAGFDLLIYSRAKLFIELF